MTAINHRGGSPATLVDSTEYGRRVPRVVARRKRRRSAGDISLFARIFMTNAAVTVVAAMILLLAPATVSSPAHLREIAVVVGGLTAILIMNLFLLRRALAPLARLTSAMRRVELLQPGRRVPVYGSDAEIVDLTHAFNDMLDRLERERQQSVRRSLAAQEAERTRVAQELHDQVGQSLTAVVLHLQRLARAASPSIREELIEARETARESLDDVRAISKRLRPEALDDLGLPSALAALTDRLADQTGTTIERRIQRSLPPLEPEAELVLYRIAQEGLTNALRHADASRIGLALTASREAVHLTVRDDGRGLDGSVPGAGIQGMRERALMVGAALRLDEAPAGGTQVALSIPVDQRPP